MRSKVMSSIRSKNTKPELMVESILSENNIKYVKHADNLIGKPDFVLKKLNLIIFVQGCFFHGCKIHYKKPKSNVKFWENKIKNNKLRDRKVTNTLRKMGWKVLHVWEHSLRRDKWGTAQEELLNKILRYKNA